MASEKLRRRLFHWTVTLVCVFGTVYQVYDATGEYMSYYTLTRMTMEEMESQVLPAVGVCYSYDQQVFGNMTIVQRLLLTPRVEEKLNHCKVLDPQTFKYTDCMRMTGVAEYVDSTLKCFSFFEERWLKSRYKKFEYGIFDRKWEILDLNMTVPAPYRLQPLLVVYPDHQMFAMKRGSHNKVWIPQDGRAEFFFTIEVEERVVLPPPYSTMCFHFENTKHKTRAVALDKCLMKNFEFQGQHYMPYQTFGSRDDGIGDLSLRTMDYNVERSFVHTAMSICDAIVPPDDCISVDYKIIAKSHKPGPPEQDTVRVVLSSLPTHSLRTILQPVIPMAEYINWIGSICNLWVGVHVMGCASFAVDIVTLKRQKKKLWRRVTRQIRSKKSRKLNAKQLHVIQTSARIACFLMATWQIYDILNIYFENPFKWNYYTKLPVNVFFPTAVFCVDRVIDDSKMQILFPRIYNTTSSEEWGRYLTVDQMLQVTLDSDYLFASSSKMTDRDSMSWDNVHKHYRYEKYVNQQDICFKTFSPDTRRNTTIPWRMYKRTLLEIMQYFSVILRVQKNKIKTIKFVIQLHQHFTLFGHEKLAVGSSQNLMFPVNPEPRMRMGKYINYHREIQQVFYADHYRADCLPYHAVYKTDRSTIISRCVKREMMRSLKDWKDEGWPRTMFYSNEMEGMDEHVLKAEPLHFSRDDKVLQRFQSKCEKRFPRPDCENTFVELFNEDFFPAIGNGSTLTLTLYPPGKGYIEMRQNLRFSILGLLGFVGGTIGFWIGFSVLDFGHLVPQVLTLLSRKSLCQVLRRNRGT